MQSFCLKLKLVVHVVIYVFQIPKWEVKGVYCFVHVCISLS